MQFVYSSVEPDIYATHTILSMTLTFLEPHQGYQEKPVYPNSELKKRLSSPQDPIQFDIALNSSCQNSHSQCIHSFDP